MPWRETCPMQQTRAVPVEPANPGWFDGRPRGSSFLERVRRADRVACGRRRAMDNHAHATADRERPGGGCPQPSDNRASDDPIRQYAVARRDHRPCDREEFSGGFRRERARASHLPPPSPPRRIKWGARPRRLRPRHRYKLAIGAGPLMRGCPTAEATTARTCGGCCDARVVVLGREPPQASTRRGTRARSRAVEDVASTSTSRPCPCGGRGRRAMAVEMRSSRARSSRDPVAHVHERFFRVTAPAVHQTIVELERRGLITRVAGQPRTIQVTLPDDELPRLHRSKPLRRGTSRDSSRCDPANESSSG